MDIEKEKIKIADEFTPMGPKKAAMDLSGLFPIPEKMTSEENIKRESSDLKRESGGLKSNRSRREDDRSWETLENSKSKKF